MSLILSLCPTLLLASFVDSSAVEHLRASSFSRSSQFEAAIAASGPNELTVVWTSRRQANGYPGVYLQRLASDGTAIGSEVQAHLWEATSHVTPAIAGLPGGGSLLVWSAYGQDGDRGSIIARRFAADGRGGDEILVNGPASGDQANPVVAVATDGTAWFAWTTDDQAIALRSLAPDGTLGAERTLVERSPGRGVRCPSIALDANAQPLVVWTEDDSAGATSVCRARLDHNLVHVDTLAMDGYEAAIASGASGSLLTWMEGDAEGHRARAARLDGHGCPIEPTIDLGRAVAAAPITLADAEQPFAIALTIPDAADPAVRRVALTSIDRSGSVGPLRTLTSGAGEQSLRLAAGTARGTALPASSTPAGVAIAWDGDGGFDDNNAVHVSLVTDQPIDRHGARAGIDPKSAQPAAGGEEQLASPHIPPRFDPNAVEHAPRTMAITDLGLGFDAIVDTGWTPPDCNMAVGPNNIIAVTNGRVSMFTKTGTQVLTDELEGAGGFFGSVTTGTFVFDPECLYDPIHDRYWVMASESTGGKSYVLLAVSDDNDAAGTWFKFKLETTALAGGTFDSPNISVDDEAVYVTGDGSSGNYQIFIWNKAPILAGSAPTIAKSLNYVTVPESCGISPISDPNEPGLYMLEHKESATNTLVKFICLRNPLTTPTLTTTELTVPSYGPPEDAPQKGTTVKIENFEARFWSVMQANGSFWACHHINSARVIVRWYEFRTNGWPTSGSLPTMRQNGNVDLGGTIRTYLCAIGADATGNAAVTFARSSPTEFISLGAAYRLASDPLGTMRPPLTIKTNTGAYTEANRWGDYASVRPDPTSGPLAPTFWVNHEYAVGASSWRSWVQAITLPEPSADLNGDGLVGAADLSILLGAWGGSGIGDLNADGVVGPEDLAILLAAWSA